ncbi:MAG: ribose-5-phosphate isomerase RpiA [Candidatus Altiarchaeales archaeon]|nr:ribose-5-phosphate isomerase RpiA [Candidatus Altiarchaeales archaeon]MBD3416291.1 ribose-5-phosphate isomerase RpiA [Candidatus Altiarchaeales archaeon]
MAKSKGKSQEADKKAAALMAVREVKGGMKLGLGTGSTVKYFIEELGRKKFPGLVVPSSKASEDLAKKSGLKVTTLDEVAKMGFKKAGDMGGGLIDLYVDGADEVDRTYNLIKGGGGALTREKVVASASTEFVCIVDESKAVAKLGKFPLPVEVLPFAKAFVTSELEELGGKVVERKKFTTDNGNIILDVTGLDFSDPLQLETELNNIAGVVENGIFAVRQPERVIISKKGKAQYM